MMSVECLDCKTLISTDDVRSQMWADWLFDFFDHHRICTRVYTCPDGSQVLCRSGYPALNLYQ